MDYLKGTTISHEQAFVFHAIQVDQDENKSHKQILADGLDWSTVQKFALRHGVLPLLYARLKSMENDLTPEQIPGEAVKELQALYLTNTLRNLRLSQMLATVLSPESAI